MLKHESDITIILDRSGSMEAIASDVIGGFNQFLADQQGQPGACRLTLVQFDDVYEVVYSGRPLADAERLTPQTFQPRGSTALLDAIGRTTNSTGTRLAALPEHERPDRVLLVIITDGLENASSDFTRERVFSMIAHQQSVYKWAFLFLAANQDAIAEGSRIGIDADQAMNFLSTGSGVAEAARSMSDAVLAFRSTGKADLKRAAKARKKVN